VMVQNAETAAPVPIARSVLTVNANAMNVIAPMNAPARHVIVFHATVT